MLSGYVANQAESPLQRAALYVGISALILSFFSTVCLYFGVYSVNLWLDIVLIVLNTVVAIILLYGLYVDSANCMLPFIFAEVSVVRDAYALTCSRFC